MLVIIDSGGANISSVIFSLQRLGCEARLTDDIAQIKKADKVILPGVGSAGNAMQILQQKNLVNCIKGLSQPVLGICLGMQLLYEKSLEGAVKCLGIISGKIEEIPQKLNLTIPHMGWNKVKKIRSSDEMLRNFEDESFCYFAHSYYAPFSKYTLATTEHSVVISAIVKKDNFYGCQFHPEKSSAAGEIILNFFLEL